MIEVSELAYDLDGYCKARGDQSLVWKSKTRALEWSKLQKERQQTDSDIAKIAKQQRRTAAETA